MNNESNSKIFLSTNIRYLRILNNKKQEDIANLCNKKNTAISNWEKGIREPDAVDLAKISKFFNISVDDLMLKDLRFDNGSIINFDSDTTLIPVFGTIKAGIPIESQNDIIDYIDIPRKWIVGDKKFYGLKISGDSMIPKYIENDIVIFEQNNDTEMYNGKDCAIMINGTESTFKKLLVNEQGIVLQPYNTKYDIMIFSKNDVINKPIKVVGIAIEKRTKI